MSYLSYLLWDTYVINGSGLPFIIINYFEFQTRISLPLILFYFILFYFIFAFIFFVILLLLLVSNFVD